MPQRAFPFGSENVASRVVRVDGLLCTTNAQSAQLRKRAAPSKAPRGKAHG